MAVGATIYKAEINISDMRRHYYASHSLTIALHPSETHERMMLRLLAFALFAEEQLVMTKGISTDDEPDLWELNLNGDIDHWIELGQPEEKRLRRACGRSKKVSLITYGGGSADVWWRQNNSKAKELNKLRVYNLSAEHGSALAALASRNMTLNVTLEDDQIWVATQSDAIEIQLPQWQ